MKFWMTLLVVFLVLGMMGIAEARTHSPARTLPPKAPPLHGTISFVSWDGMRLWVTPSATAPDGTKSDDIIVVADGTTVISLNKAKGKKLCDLSAGDTVDILSGSGTSNAVKSITAKGKVQKKLPHLLGKISLVSLDHITVTPQDPEPDNEDLKVLVNDTTQITINKAAGNKLKDLYIGDVVDITPAAGGGSVPVMSIKATNNKK